MNLAVVREIERRGGAASRGHLLRVTSRGVLDNELASRRLVSPFPRSYCLAVDADQRAIRERAALISVGHPGALSHATALGRWRLLKIDTDPIDVTVPLSRHPRRHDGLRVHRVVRYPGVVRLDGLLTTDIADSIADSWPQLAGSDQRAPALTAARQRLVRPSQLRNAVAQRPRLPGRADLLTLIALLEAGCESELELWGYLGVFTIPELNHGVRQRTFRVGGRRYRADLAYEAERTIVELDGRKYHASSDQWERDIARDLALATIGWQTIRLSHHRLTNDVDGVRRDVLAVLASRLALRT